MPSQVGWHHGNTTLLLVHTLPTLVQVPDTTRATDTVAQVVKPCSLPVPQNRSCKSCVQYRGAKVVKPGK